MVEVVNGRSLGPGVAGARAAALARETAKPAGAGSDAHFGREVGVAYMVVAALPTRETWSNSLRADAWSTASAAGIRTRTGVCRRLAPVTRLRRQLPGHPI